MSSTSLETARSILVLLAAGGFIAVVTYDLHAPSGGGWRMAFLEASVLFGLLVWALSEGLGAVKALGSAGVWAGWALAAAVASIAAARRSIMQPEKSIASEFGRLSTVTRSIHPGAKWALVYVAIAGIVLATIAFAAAPNTWDSMTYHLSRVMHWHQNRSLEFYPTAIQRQLAFGPWAEMAMLQLQVLAGSDQLANFVQFFALTGCAAAVSLLAQQLGGGFWAQIFSALMCLTLPMGVLQSTSTQNDLVTAFWCTSFAAALLMQQRTGKGRGLHALFVGAAASLAVLTKATALIFLAPFAIWHLVESVRRERWGAWRSLMLTLGAAVIVLAPHSLRNYSLFGNPLGAAPGPELSGYTNEVLGAPMLISNVLRNSSLQLAVPSSEINTAAQHLVEGAHALMGIDASDPRTTWSDARYEIVFSMYEDNAANPAHFLLLLFAAPVLVWHRSSGIFVFELCTLAAFALFCLLLRWQPWNTRLMLPLLILATPAAAVSITRVLPGARILFPGMGLALLAIPYVIANPTRPLYGPGSILTSSRLQQYFTNVPDDPGVYMHAAQIVHGADCDRIGLASSPEGREYLLWVSNRIYNRAIRIEHIMVRNRSGRYRTDFTPCAIAVTYPYAESKMVFEDTLFESRLSTERFSLFLPAGGLP